MFGLPTTDTSLSLIFSVLHHTLATPLTTLRCSLEELGDLSDIQGKKKRLLSIQAAQNRLCEVINQLQLAAPHTLRYFSPIQSCIELFPLFHRADRQLEVFYEPSDLSNTLFGNAFLFSEAVVCLLQNAFEAYPPNAHQLVFIHFVDSAQHLEVVIRDFGNGIHWWQLPFIFYNQVSFKRKNTGLGLAFVQRVVREHFKGTIKVIPKTVGTEVRLRLPHYQTAYSQTP